MKKLFLILNLVVSINLLSMAPRGLLELSSVDVELFPSYDALEQTQAEVKRHGKAKTKVETIKIPKTVASKFRKLKEHCNGKPFVFVTDNQIAFEYLLGIAHATNMDGVVAQLDTQSVVDVLRMAVCLGFDNLDPIVSEVASKLALIDCGKLLSLPDDVQGLVAKSWVRENMAELACKFQSRIGKLGYCNYGLFLKDSRLIVIAKIRNDLIVEVYEGEGRWSSQKIECAGSITSVALSEDKKMIVTGGDKGEIIVWNYEFRIWSSHKLKDWNISSEFVRSVALSEDKRMIVTGAENCWKGNGEIIVWSDEGGRWSSQKLECDIGPVDSVALSKDKKMIVAGGDHGVIVCNYEGGRWSSSQTFNLSCAGIKSVVLSEDKKMIVAGGYGFFNENGRLAILSDKGEGWNCCTIRDGISIKSVALSKDKKMIVAGGKDHDIMIWSHESGEWRGQKLKGPGGCVALSEDKRTIFSVLDDVFIWNLPTKEDLTLPIVYTIAKDKLSECEKRLLRSKINIDKTHQALAKDIKKKLW
jgi:hypothetical protein